jgi:membrane dipeptidase
LFENNYQIDINKLCQFENSIEFFAVWLNKQKLITPFKTSMEYINFYNNEIKKYDQKIKDKNINLFLAIEGGEALENNISNLEKFYDRGVKLLTLTWNNENELGGGTNSNSGLKKFGIDVIKKMDELNMIIDVSHASEKTFWDVCKFSNSSIVASHSNCKQICKHKRNLTDDQIKAIRERKGLIGINLYSNFLKEDNKTNLYDVIKHIDHLLNLSCENNICWGCDFDGAESFPEEIKNITSMKKVYDIFLNLFGESTTKKIFFDNIKKFLVRRKLMI